MSNKLEHQRHPSYDRCWDLERKKDGEGEEDDGEDEVASLIPTYCSIPRPQEDQPWESSELMMLAVIFDSMDSVDPVTETLVSMRLPATVCTIMALILSMVPKHFT